jgi:hypothetical protein
VSELGEAFAFGEEELQFNLIRMFIDVRIEDSMTNESALDLQPRRIVISVTILKMN